MVHIPAASAESEIQFPLNAVQRFVELPSYTEVNPGEDALLKCRISDKKGICSWQKDNKAEERLTVYDRGSGRLTPSNKDSPREKDRLTAWSQTNASEVERPRVWAARSVLEMGATRSAHGKQLACRAHHPSYPAPYYRDSYTMLDVTFVPVVSILGADASGLSSLEEGSSALSLDCKADGNPKPYVWWTKDGQIIATNGPKLILAPVIRNHSGIYGCQARNSLGTSDSVKIEIDVKYPPRVTWVGPDTVVEANLFSQVTLDCRAEGNPAPSYQWYHSPGSRSINNLLEDGYLISSTPQLQLYNVSYNQHGQYVCVAKNFIGLEERSQQSSPVTLNILGPPVGPEAVSAHGWSGGEARAQAAVCAEPPPRSAAWLWGSLRLNVPSHMGRYRALEAESIDGCYRYTLAISSVSASDARVYVLHVENERGVSSHAVSLTVHGLSGRYRALEAESIDGCYRYTLAISSVSASDARVYVLHVENERGVSSHAVSLTVHDNFSLTETAHVAPLIAAALVIAALLVLLLCLIVRCRRKRGSVEYKTDELNSDVKVLPADAVYTPQSHASGRGSIAGVAPAPGAGMAPPPGAGEREGPRYSPGALQVRRAALVLQPPTTAALASLEREAKENVYAVLDPHIQYDITINKHGEPPKYLSLSKPLTHQRTHAFDPRYFANEINNNEIKLSTFKPAYRKSNRSNKSKNVNYKKNYVCKSNNDIEYSKDPCFGIVRGTEGNSANAYTHSSRNDVNKISKDMTFERNSFIYNSSSNNKMNGSEKDLLKSDPKNCRLSNRSRKSVEKTTPLEEEKKKESSTIEQKVSNVRNHEDTIEDYKPRPGKVREIASKFDRNTKSYAQSLNFKKERPRPIQSYGYQAYLDHIFPDAVEI
ncbi:Neural cell adhesion molecule 1 [Papilio xuthus]|uniref:Neural cell adhesion molecule 1 n=1 Tax=Papilio xuthus TaxID=66420 RepID=A0A194PSF6_PAPXU|nr:Neural cell adhesion molecule 1 [Papilio xuthus]